MKPIISYYGGKQRIASKIVPLIPRHTVYCEPFAGGATLLFAKPWPAVSSTHDYREIINDHDERLISFYRCLQDPETREELITRLQFTLYSEAEYRRAKEILKQKNGNAIEAAWAYYVDIQQSVANKLNSGWGRAVYGGNHAATWVNKVIRLPEYLDRIASINIASTDALTCIRQWDSPQTFFYCDPPYVGTDQGDYKGWTLEKQHELIDALDGIQGSMLLSGYDHTDIQIPAGWVRHEIRAYCSASGKGRTNADRTRAATRAEMGNTKRTEIVYYKPRSAALRPEIQALFDSGKYDCFVGDRRQLNLGL